MDFKEILVNLLTALILVGRRFFLLIISPYKTLRKISLEKDWLQVLIIFMFVFLYFQLTGRNKNFLFFIVTFLLTIFFFFLFSRISRKDISLKSFVFTFSYSLLPTLIWFVTNSILYFSLPPPRTLSLLGRAFSIFFVAFSLSLLLWKIILVYLAIRFSSKLNFYRIIYMMVLYGCILAPYSVLMYYWQIFRVPFI